MANRNDDDSQKSECEELVDQLSELMQLTPEETSKFKHTCMIRAGYKAEPKYKKVKEGKTDVDTDDAFFL